MKKSPEIIFDSERGSLAYFEEQLQNLDARGVKGVTFFIGGEYPHTQQGISAFLKSIPVPVSGGISPEVIYEGEYYDNGMLAILWFDEMKVKTFLQASDLSSPLYNQKEPIFDSTKHVSSLIFSNTKTRAAEAALDALYYRTGQSLQYAGGGMAYSLTDMTPSIATNDGLVADALQVTLFPYQQKTTVGHGWSVLSGPHLVTESVENKIKTLDYQEIKPYYESLIRSSLGDEVKDLTIEEMKEIFPVGIQPYDDTMIIRAVVCFENGEMQFVGDIPEFSSVYILTGEQESLLSFMEESAEGFREIATESPDLSIVFSCIGRRLHMAEHSQKELDILTENLGSGKRIVGFTSVGEIASNSTGLACLHSMTLVVANLWV